MKVFEDRASVRSTVPGRARRGRALPLLLAGALMAAGTAALPDGAAAALPDGSVILKQFSGLRAESGVNTYISSGQYACGIVGLAGLDGDINEDDDGDIIYAFAYPSGGTWWIKADFRSHSGDHEGWDIDLLCVDNGQISVGGPSTKPLFLKTFTNLGDNVDYDTGIATSSWVCGIVGFQALDGDINENGDGTIMRMYMFQQVGRWRIRADFRTHHDDENWARIDVLCAGTSVATIGTPSTSSSKQLFLKEYSGLANNGFYNTGISDSSFVCGVVGMEAYDGDIEEHDSGNIIEANAYRQSGTWRIRTDFRTHNDHENWNVKLLCIDRPVAEDQGPCPLGCTDGGNAVRNACVPFVQSRFDEITTYQKQFKINNYGPGELYWDYIDFEQGSPCHFQGMARLPQSHPFIAMSANSIGGDKSFFSNGCFYPNEAPNGFGAHLFIARMGSKGSGSGAWGGGWSPSQDNVVSHLLLHSDKFNYWHPGGMQAIGNYLVVGVDSGEDDPSHVFTIKVSNPYSPVKVDDLYRSHDRAEAVAIVRESSDKYLLAVGTDSSQDVEFYRSLGTNIEDPDYQPLGFINWIGSAKEGNYNNMALVRECGTNQIFLIGAYNTGLYGEIGGTNKAQLWKLNLYSNRVDAYHVRTRDFGDAGSIWSAGVGLYVRSATGEIAFYSSEKYPNAAAFGGSNNDLDTDEWW